MRPGVTITVVVLLLLILGASLVQFLILGR